MLRLVEPSPRTDTLVISLPAVVGSWLTVLTGRVFDRMVDGGIEDPLGAPVTVAAFVADLYDVAGVPIPLHIAERIGT